MFSSTMILGLVALVAAFGLGKLAIAEVVAVTLLLAYEHSLVSSRDLQTQRRVLHHERRDLGSVLFFRCGDLLLRR